MISTDEIRCYSCIRIVYLRGLYYVFCRHSSRSEDGAKYCFISSELKCDISWESEYFLLQCKSLFNIAFLVCIWDRDPLVYKLTTRAATWPIILLAVQYHPDSHQRHWSSFLSPHLLQCQWQKLMQQRQNLPHVHLTSIPAFPLLLSSIYE